MQKPKFFRTAVLGLLALTSSLLVPFAHAQSEPGMAMKGDMNKPTPMMAGGMDMKPMMTDMNNKMSTMKSSGNMDVDFAMMMRVHHQAALTMAEAELQHGKDPQMRVMAKDIIYAQKKEIAVFDKFLAKHGESGMTMSK